MRKLLLFLMLHSVQLFAAAPPTVTVASTYYNADGTLYNGSARITSPPFTCAGANIAGVDKTLTVVNGVVSTQLVPNVGCIGTVGYTVVYTVGLTRTTRYWSIPPSPSTTTIDAVQSSLQPSLGLYISLSNIPFGVVGPGQYLGRSDDGTSWVGRAAAGESFITPGTINQYWRGDKTWQAFPTIPTNTSQLPELTNLYFTNSRAISAVSGTYVPLTRTIAGRPLSSDIVLTKTDVGLNLVDNTPDTAKPISTAQQIALDLKAPLASPTFTGTVSGITKAMVGLSNLDNTSDINKPVSTLQAEALATKPTKSSGSGVPITTPAAIGDTHTDTDVGGLSYTAYCTSSPACWRSNGSGSENSASPNYLQSFTNQTTVVLTHGFGTVAVVPFCIDTNGDEVRGAIKAITTTTLTVEFAVQQSGSCTVNGSGGGGTGSPGSPYVLPPPTTTTIGGVKRNVGSTGEFVKGFTTDGTVEYGTPAGGPGGSITIDSTLKQNLDGTYGVNGAVIPLGLSASTSLTFPAISNGACANATTTMTLSQALNGDSVIPGWPSAMPTGFSGVMYVSAPNAIAVRLCNHSGGSVTPTAGLTYKATIVRSF